MVKNPPADSGDMRDAGLIPELERSPGEGNSLQYSCLENSTDRGTLWAIVHVVTKSQTWLNTHTHTLILIIRFFRFPDSSVGKESACNAEDPGLIPGSGRSAGEGIGYLLQYSWASLVAQLVKNLPAMLETWVWSLSWEDPLEKGKATHSSILA